MREKTKQAIEIYQQGRQAELEGRAILAESYYLQSRSLFEEAGESGSAQYLNAATTLNALTFLRWSRDDYEGALRSAKESVKIMEAYHPQFITSADANLIYGTSCELMDQMQYQMSLVSTR